MAKFVYKMQSILNIEYKLESQAKSELAARNAKLHEEEEVLMQLNDRKNSYEKAAKKLLNEVLNIREIQNCTRAVEIMKEQIQKQLLAVNIAQRNVESARQHLQEVVIDRKTQEKLKENAFFEFMKEESAAESKEIDQLVSFTHGAGKRQHEINE